MARSFLRHVGLVILVVACCFAGGCSAILSSTMSRMADSLSAAVLDQNDPDTVRQGAPAYLVLIDGLISDAPDNPGVLLAGASLYSSYGGAFVDDSERAKRLTLKGRNYGWRGLCSTASQMCGIWARPYDEFEVAVGSLEAKHLPALFTAATAWAGWIQANKDDWSAIADKARVDAMIRRVVAIDPQYDRGAPFLYLGVLATLLPKAMGGTPEEGRADFERAIELSDGRNLMAKMMLARQYARLVFDRELHDRLCREVLEADPEEPGLTLANTLARDEARRLLDDSEDYFGD